MQQTCLELGRLETPTESTQQMEQRSKNPMPFYSTDWFIKNPCMDGYNPYTTGEYNPPKNKTYDQSQRITAQMWNNENRMCNLQTIVSLR